ncbi:MAG: O-antigen ligase family protein [Pirellulaceae bacterium]|nr:O-antigen ligase family protein [Pirellulaceae bacterium]
MSSKAVSTGTLLTQTSARTVSATTWMDYAGWISLCLMALVPLVDFEASEEIRVSKQLLVKLAILGCSGVYCLWVLMHSSRVRSMAIVFPPVALLGLIGLLVLAAFQSPIPREALVSAGSALVVCGLTLGVATRLGAWSALYAIFAGQGLFVLGSWIAYLFVPSIGVFLEPIPDGEFFERMGGLAHPNTLGQLSAFCILFTLILAAEGKWSRKTWRYLAVPLLIIAAGALVYSASRSSLAACGLAALIGLRSWWFSGMRQVLIVGGFFLGVLTLFALLATTSGEDFLQRKIFTKLSKSGTADELATGTGRDVIWSTTIKYIQERPILGYGCGISKILLRDTSGYAHNMVLHVALSGGVFAAGFLVILLLNGVMRFLTQPNWAADTMLWFLIINGLTENVIFENIASGATAILMLTLAWRTLMRVESEDVRRQAPLENV